MSAPRFVLVGEDHAGHVHRWNVDATNVDAVKQALGEAFAVGPSFLARGVPWIDGNVLDAWIEGAPSPWVWDGGRFPPAEIIAAAAVTAAPMG